MDTLYKLKKIHKLLQKVNTLSNRDEIFNDIYKYIKTRIKPVTKKSLPKQIENKSLQKIYERIFDDINQLGKPFTKTQKNKNTKTYRRTMKYIKRYYKKYRYEIVDIFQLGYSYFNNPNFVYKPKKISCSDFFKFQKTTIQYLPHLSRYTNSWFKEFAKGRQHIDNNFLRRKKDSHKDLTKTFIEIWQKTKYSELTIFDENSIIMFVQFAYDFSLMNRLSTRTLFEIIQTYLTDPNNSFIESPKFLASEYFWKKEIYKILLKSGIFKSRREIKNVY